MIVRFAYGILCVTLGLWLFTVRHDFVAYILHHSRHITLPPLIKRPIYEDPMPRRRAVPNNNKERDIPIEPPTKIEKGKSKGEEQCRSIFQDIFHGKLFPSIRPNFLYNPIAKERVASSDKPFEACPKSTLGHCLELDGFNEELMIAFEYQGRQHEEYIPYFHRSIDIYEAQRYRDHIKAELCAKWNINLVVIPYHSKDLRVTIIQKLTTQGLLPK